MTENILEIRHLTHIFTINGRIRIKALEDVSFTLRKGEIYGLVGESGSGKSTIARCIMNILHPTEGQILFKGIDTTDPRQFRRNRKMLQRERQIIFQDSTSSLNRHMTAAQCIMEPMQIHRIKPPRGTLREEAAFQMRYVGLEESCLDKYPAALSGGMRQRVAIARALAMEPELLVADEPIAALDVSIQAQIINLFKHLQAEHGFTILFIAHDLAAVKYLCDRIGVLYRGRLVETAPKNELFANPIHPYTKSLLSAIPLPDPQREKARVLLEYDPGCIEEEGALREISPGHLVWKGERA